VAAAADYVPVDNSPLLVDRTAVEVLPNIDEVDEDSFPILGEDDGLVIDEQEEGALLE
jgi:hypothetical protein